MIRVYNGLNAELTADIDSVQTVLPVNLSYEPTLNTGDTFILVSGEEAVLVTSVDTGAGTITVQRGYEGTAVPHVTGDVFLCTFTPGTLSSFDVGGTPGNISTYEGGQYTSRDVGLPVSTSEYTDFFVVHAKMYDAVSFEEIPDIPLRAQPNNIDVSPDGTLLSAAGTSGTIEIVNLSTKEQVYIIALSSGTTWAYWLSDVLLICGTTTEVYTLDISVSPVLTYVFTFSFARQSIKPTPNRQFLVGSAASSVPLEVIDLTTFEEVATSVSGWGDSSSYYGNDWSQMDISADGAYVYCMTGYLDSNPLKVVSTASWGLFDEPYVGLGGMSTVAADPDDANELACGYYNVNISSGYPYAFFQGLSRQTSLTDSRSVYGLLFTTNESSNNARIRALKYSEDGRYFFVQRRSSFSGVSLYAQNKADWSLNVPLTVLLRGSSSLPLFSSGKIAGWRQGLPAATASEPGPKGLQGIVASDTAPDTSQIWVVDNNGN